MNIDNPDWEKLEEATFNHAVEGLRNTLRADHPYIDEATEEEVLDLVIAKLDKKINESRR